jgi:putative lipoic acid-binding regulatory protein
MRTPPDRTEQKRNTSQGQYWQTSLECCSTSFEQANFSQRPAASIELRQSPNKKRRNWVENCRTTTINSILCTLYWDIVLLVMLMRVLPSLCKETLRSRDSNLGSYYPESAVMEQEHTEIRILEHPPQIFYVTP